MPLTRRGFLTSLLAGGAGLALGAELDLERLLWVPKPIITVPAMPGVGLRAGFVTPDWIVREALRLMEHNLMRLPAVERGYHPAFGSNAEPRIRMRYAKAWDLG